MTSTYVDPTPAPQAIRGELSTGPAIHWSVTLTGREFLLAAQVGVLRQIENLAKGRHHAHGAGDADGWQMHVEGACAEAAVAKRLGLYWCGNLGNLHAADVGALQVRATRHAGGSLIVHERDPDAIYVLAVGTAPTFRLIGWLRAAEARKPQWWSDPSGQGRPAFFVAQNALHDMTELRGHA